MGEIQTDGLRPFREIIGKRFQDVKALASHGSAKFGVARLLQRFPERVELEPSSDHTINVSVGGFFAVERYDGDRLSHRISRPNTTTIIPAGTASSWRADGLVDAFQIYINDRALRDLALEKFDIAPERLKVFDMIEVDDGFLRSLALTLFVEIRDGDINDSMLLDSFYLVLAQHFLRRYTNAAGRAPTPPKSAKSIERWVYDRASRYILDNLHHRFSLDDVTTYAGVPAVRLRECFRSQVGLTPYQFVLQARLARAQEYLSTSKMPIVEIAYSCGFSSQSHMTSAFSSRLGIAPGEFRKGAKS